MQHTVQPADCPMGCANWLFFNGLPLLATRGLQNGFRNGAREFGMMLLTGGPFFFLFHMQSKAHYFTQTLIYGGAKYRATGRGFMLQHESFDEMYRFYYSSHFAPGMEMLLLLILWAGYASWENTSFILSSWSIWLIFVAWVFSPFFFNPLGFVWDKTIRDAEQWWDWMHRKSLSSDTSWMAWWKEEETPRTQGSCSVRVIGSLMSVKWLLLAMAATTQVQGKTALHRFPLMLIMWLGLLVLGWIALLLFRVLRRETQRGLRGIKAAGFFALVGFVYWCATYSPDGDALSVKEWFDVAFAAVLTHAAVCQVSLCSHHVCAALILCVRYFWVLVSKTQCLHTLQRLGILLSDLSYLLRSSFYLWCRSFKTFR